MTATKPTPTAVVEYRIVYRPFEGDGQTRVSGEVVNINTPAWRNAGMLEQLRYLRTPTAPLTPVESKDGRLFIDEASRDRYEASATPARKPKRATAAARS